jgi:hypothetical protein
MGGVLFQFMLAPLSPVANLVENIMVCTFDAP